MNDTKEGGPWSLKSETAPMCPSICSSAIRSWRGSPTDGFCRGRNCPRCGPWPVSYTHLGQNVHGAGGGLQLPGQDFQEGGLAGAIGADDAVAVAPEELQVDIGEQRGAAVLQAQIGNSDHSFYLSA